MSLLQLLTALVIGCALIGDAMAADGQADVQAEAQLPGYGQQNTCGGYPKTTCPESHLCCAVDSGDDAGFCCPQQSRNNATYSCAFGIAGLGESKEVLRVRNCCEGRPVCGSGVGERYCCMGARSKLHKSGCSAVGPPVCCNSMCGDDLCDTECKWLGGVCQAGSAAEGGSCRHPVTRLAVVPPLV